MAESIIHRLRQGTNNTTQVLSATKLGPYAHFRRIMKSICPSHKCRGTWLCTGNSATRTPEIIGGDTRWRWGFRLIDSMLRICPVGTTKPERSIAVKSIHTVLLLLIWTSASTLHAQETWPQAAGPNGSWTTVSGQRPPTHWSGSTGQNMRWETTLEEGGQSGIAVFGDRLFLTMNKPLPVGTTVKDAVGTDIVGLCIDAKTGKELWQIDLAGKSQCRTRGYSPTTLHQRP